MYVVKNLDRYGFRHTQVPQVCMFVPFIVPHCDFEYMYLSFYHKDTLTLLQKCSLLIAIIRQKYNNELFPITAKRYVISTYGYIRTHNITKCIIIIILQGVSSLRSLTPCACAALPSTSCQHIELEHMHILADHVTSSIS